MGNTMGTPKTPSLKSSRENSCASLLSPSITGMMGVWLLPVSKPSCCRPLRKNSVFFRSLGTIVLSFSRICREAVQAATVAGGAEPLSSQERDLLYAYSQMGLEPQT